MHLSFPGARRKISFLLPVRRENFANALGQTCIHDLRLRLRMLILQTNSTRHKHLTNANKTRTWCWCNSFIQTMHLLAFKLKNCAPVRKSETGDIYSSQRPRCLSCFDHVISPPCLKCSKLDFVPHTHFLWVKTCKNYWNWFAGFCACAPILRFQREIMNLFWERDKR